MEGLLKDGARCDEYHVVQWYTGKSHAVDGHFFPQNATPPLIARYNCSCCREEFYAASRKDP
jgi:hypothetical protein